MWKCFVCGIIGFGVFPYCVLAEEIRTWNSLDGKFQVQASLQEQKTNSVVLRRVDGGTVEVPINLLSASDVQFIRDSETVASPLPAADAVSAVDRAAGESLRADEAASIFKAYFTAWPPLGTSRFAYDASLAKWTSVATANRVRRGRIWVDVTEASTTDKNVEDLLQQSLQLIAAKNGDEARSLLQKAAAADPIATTASVLTGLIYATALRDYNQAKSQFSDARTRDPFNHAVLNNLAIVEFRLGNVTAAMGLWQQAIDLAPYSPTVRRNISNLSRRNAAGIFQIPSTSTATLRSLEISAAIKESAPTGNDAWIYSPPTAKPESTAYGTGFVVRPGLVLTHIPEFQPNRPVVVFESSQPLSPISTQVVAHDPETGLLLLAAEALHASPLQMADEFPRRGTNIRVAGYVRPTYVGDSFRFAIGAIAAEPTAASDELFVCTSSLHLGPGLNPTLDARGQIVGATVAVRRVGQVVGFGLANSTLKSFLEKHRPADEKATSPAQQLNWEAVEQEAKRSVVFVRQPRDERTDLCTAAGLSLEDAFCDRCRGLGFVDCPERGCANGGILVKVATVTGRLPSGDDLITINKVRTPCDRCSGEGKVRCPICAGDGRHRSSGSIDPNQRLR